MPNIRRPPGRFGPVAPGIGGAGLRALGGALEAFADLGTNRELLGIQEQEQADQLEFAQFEKVERSEAIAQFTQKQIWRNQESERVLSEAKQARDFSGVQEAMNGLEDDFNAELFQGRSQVFRDAFESMDRSARVGQINQLGTAVQAGNLGLIQENFQSAARAFVDAVGPLSDPAEIAERFADLADAMVGMGFTQAAIEAISGDGLRDAMEKYVLSLPLVDGLAALSDEAVAGALGEDGRERMLRDLITKENTLRTAQEIISDAHAEVVEINVLRELANNVPASVLIARILADEEITGAREQDLVDLIGAIERGRAKEIEKERARQAKAISKEEGARQRFVKSEKMDQNHTISENSMALIMGAHKDNSDPRSLRFINTSPEDRLKEQIELHRQGMAVLAEATRLAVIGEFSVDELIDLGFSMIPLSEGLVEIDQDKEGFLERARRGFGLFSGPVQKRVPNALVQKVRSDMLLGEGRYGGFDPGQRTVMGRILVSIAIGTEGSGDTVPTDEAITIADKIFAAAEKRFNSEEFGLTGEAAKRASELVFNSTLATKPRQQPRVDGAGGLIAEINALVAAGKTLDEIEEKVPQRSENFDKPAFDRAMAIVRGGEI